MGAGNSGEQVATSGPDRVETQKDCAGDGELLSARRVRDNIGLAI